MPETVDTSADAVERLVFEYTSADENPEMLVATLRALLAERAEQAAETRRLAREIDIAMHGEKNAAPRRRCAIWFRWPAT